MQENEQDVWGLKGLDELMPVRWPEVKRLIGPHLHEYYCTYYGITPYQAHECKNCKVEPLKVFTKKEKVYVHNYREKMTPTGIVPDWCVFFSTPYALGDQNLESMYVCSEYGKIHC